MAGMTAAFALILAAQAVTTCPTTAAPRLGGGAALVRENGGAGATPFERLGPTTSVVGRPVDIQQTGAEIGAPLSQVEPAAEQCPAVAFPIA